MNRLSSSLLLSCALPWALACALTWTGSALGAPSTAQARLRAESEERARAEASDLLRTLCPEQCVLVAVEARVEEETVGGAAPGFESLTAGAPLPTLRSVTARVLVDSQLPGPFRTRLKDLVAQRLKAVSAQPTVEVESVAFPPRNAPHLEAPPREAKPPPAATPTPPPAAEPEKKAQAEAPPLGARAGEKLLEAAPLLAVAVLLALTVLVLGGLLVVATRRSGTPSGLEYGPEPLPPLEPVAPVAPTPSQAYPPRRAGRLERTLREERSVRNAVVREALARGELRQVAAWTRELGEFLLEDLRGDPALAQSLSGLAAELGRVPDGDEGSRSAVLYDLEGRAIAARLTQADGSVEMAFAFLEGVRPERFATACLGLASGAREVALRFAPSALRTAALQSLTSAQRRELALGLARQPELSTRYALAVADDLRAQLSESTGGASQLERVLGEVLDTLSMADQDRLIERLRQEGSERLAASLLTESSLVSAPVDVLGAALLRLPAAQVVSYLTGAEGALREQLLQACPASLQRELREELGLRGAGRPEEFTGARRELLACVKDEMVRRGLSLSQNGARPGRVN